MKQKFFKKFLFVFKSRYKFFPPPRYHLIIYDFMSAETIIKTIQFNKSLKKYKIGVISTRGEEINIFILLLSIIRNAGSITFQNYLETFINYVNPKIILSYLDVDQKLVNIKKNNTKYKIFAIQNGLLSINRLKKCEKNMKLFSKVFLFSESYREYFAKKFQDKIIVIGGISNNLSISKKDYKKNKKNIYFISQLREIYLYGNQKFLRINSNQVSLDKFYLPERFLLPILSKFCEKHKYRLNILGSFLINQKLEKSFFQNLIGESFNFIENKYRGYHYKIINKKDNFVFIDSYLGYEALAKQKKVCVFSFRGHFIKQKDRNFGFPLVMPKKGIFWTSQPDSNKIVKILNNMIDINSKDWKKILNNYKKYYYYDKDNRKLSNSIYNTINNKNDIKL